MKLVLHLLAGKLFCFGCICSLFFSESTEEGPRAPLAGTEERADGAGSGALAVPTPHFFFKEYFLTLHIYYPPPQVKFDPAQ